MNVIIIVSHLQQEFGSMATPKNSLGYMFGVLMETHTTHTPHSFQCARGAFLPIKQLR
jgi:hypothetical protein